MKQFSHTEDYIKKIYSYLQITNPAQLNEFAIADKLNIGLYPIDGKSEAIFSDGRQYIFINRNLESQERWQEFGHELCHVLWHAGDQSEMPPPFREYQEWKANLFALHFCIPTFMLQRIRLPTDKRAAVTMIAKTFNVDFRFAEERLTRHFKKLHAGGMQVAEKQDCQY